ncbi:MAG: YigZ family protein [Bacteroidales bacterium]|nr:YigZ family protein [Bacteroidales bacterium]
MDTYNTIQSLSEGNFKVKGSKFLSFAFPVETEDEIKTIVANLKKEYYDACHHCYAYILGYNSEKYRENDDGEPSGTAGKPICGQLRSKQLTNILVVVVRYFGGTKLGVSGLIDAYKNVTSDVLQNAKIIEKIVMKEHQISFDYEQTNAVMKIVKDYNLQVISQSFDSRSELVFKVRLSDENRVLAMFEKLSCNFF